MKQQTSTMAVLSRDTFHAPAERSDIDQLRTVNAQVEATPHIKTLIDAMPFVVLILNRHRQIVAANKTVYTLLGVSIQDILGKRPGETIGCIHAIDGPNGCGTSTHCKVCGAVNAFLQTTETDEKITEECRITLTDGNALDWEVTTSPLIIDGHSLTCMGVRDISHKKRRRALERTFFHDIINQLGAITGFAKIVSEQYTDSEELKEVDMLTTELLEEIQGQRDMALAENGDLVPRFESIQLKPLMERLAQLYRSHPVAEDRSIEVSVPQTLTVRTDVQLLKRIVGNMLKNALEASGPGQTISLSCDGSETTVSIHVHNPAVIPQDSQLQIFKRSFSTKGGSGRGIGTYSMKLLGERYLKGHVSFESNTQTGTVFTIRIPTNPQ